MGVTGLWGLIEPVGQPVSMETLENKVLAIDASIWLNQAIKGFRDAHGQAVANAHLIALYNRVCKLLYFKIKPVFVFDGEAPYLKQQTLEERRKRKCKLIENSRKTVNRVLLGYLSTQVDEPVEIPVRALESTNLLSSFLPRGKDESDDFFVLPEEDSTSSDTVRIQQEASARGSSGHVVSHSSIVSSRLREFQNFDDIDVKSPDFLSLPPEIRHEILTNLKERRIGFRRLHSLPQDSTHFSSFQISKLLHKQKLQKHIDDTVEELNANGLDGRCNEGRIVSDAGTSFVYFKESDNRPAKFNRKHSSKTDQKTDKFLKKASLDDDIFGNASGFDYGKSEASKLDGTNLMQRCVIDFEGKESISTNENLADSSQLKNQCNNNGDEALSSFSSEILKVHPTREEVAFEDLFSPSDFEMHESIENDPVVTELMSDDGSDDDDSEPIIILQPSEQSKTKHMAVMPSNEPFHLIDDDFSDEEARDISQAIKNSLDEYQAVKTGNVRLANEVLNVDSDTNSESNHAKSFLEVENLSSDKLNKNAVTAAEAAQANATPSSSSIGVPVAIKASFSSAGENIKESSLVKVSIEKPSTSRGICANSSPVQTTTISRETIIADIRKANASERYAETVTDKMEYECKELLDLFGIPYIVSPTEAESQCAALESIGLTDGTITEDSDVWLFGAKTVYKNFFTQSKYLEVFKALEIEAHFKLCREAMICLALLTGSDYTTGIEGVGPVTAIEILSEFPGKGLEPLEKFKSWWVSKKSGSDKTPGNKIRAKLLKLSLDESFPNTSVFEAYLRPTVDESPEKFSWARPDLDLIRQYAASKLGWSQKKVDETLLPVLKKLSQRQTQTRIDRFFQPSVSKGVNTISSKRVAQALGRLEGPSSSSPTKKGASGLDRGSLKEKVKRQRLGPKRAKRDVSRSAEANKNKSSVGSRGEKSRPVGRAPEKQQKTEAKKKVDQDAAEHEKKQMEKNDETAEGLGLSEDSSSADFSDSGDEAARRVCL